MKENIRDIIERLEHLMYGYNFQVSFGADLFEGATQEDFQKSIKIKYPDTNPNQYPLTALSSKECIDEIKSCFDFRGDNVAGLKLSAEKEVLLSKIQNQYLEYINQFINTNTKIYNYIDPNGIPGVPVYWDYCFAIFTDKNKIIYIWGFSSD